eukprot:CAMPEP_0198109888 /NCGR_PEP_ID=MMETSP1442-20131203/1933_1 /TAXON_ID= /ORGANISM="Craspedostauros australis, Strain CCMP3328" /LENGTH=62 /DNA_ID=CAMNT_0043765727 /DNA_START=69 /DNA_END=254 /DNA_ORIENTATION=-
MNVGYENGFHAVLVPGAYHHGMNINPIKMVASTPTVEYVQAVFCERSAYDELCGRRRLVMYV